MADIAGARAVVNLTIDFDAICIWMTWGATGNRALGRGEFGGREAAPRLLDIFERTGVETTWFVPGHSADLFPDVVRRAAENGHEIANHGYAHEAFDQLAPADVRRVVRLGSDAIERITGSRPVGIRVPAGDFDGSLFELLVEEGFIYDSSIVGEFSPSWCRKKDTLRYDGPNEWGARLDLVELPLSFVMNDFCYFEFNYSNPQLVGMVGPDHVYDIWSRQFDWMYENVDHGILNVTMHPQSIGWGLRSAMLERFIRHCQERDSVVFSDCRTVANEYRNADHPSNVATS